jgi:hypothetical protein
LLAEPIIELTRKLTGRETVHVGAWFGRRPWFARAVALLLTLAVVMLPARGRAQTMTPPAPLLNEFRITASTSFYRATSDQHSALQRLQEQAIANTLADHGLSSDDARAAQTWARGDATAELWALLVQAINAPNRTADQQQAVAWLTDLVVRQGVRSARFAGLEYVKWAGLNQGTYATRVDAYNAAYANGSDTTQAEANLESFLQSGFTAPQPYADWTDGTSTATKIATAQAGFCVYRSPDPYPTDYQGNIFSGTNASAPPICFIPGGGIGCTIDCNPDTPAYEDFVKWGTAVSHDALLDSSDFTEVAHDIALGVGLGGIALSVAAGILLGTQLGSALAGTAFQLALFPFATVVTTGSAYAGTTVAATAGVVSASAAAAVVAIVILFIVGTTLESIQVAQQFELPGKLAQLIEDAPKTTYDLKEKLGSSDGAGELYALFVNATLPSPRTDCLSIGGGTEEVCLAPSGAPPANLQQDPQFLVRTNGGSPSLENSIQWYVASAQTTNSARLHGNWFIIRSTDNMGRSLKVRNLSSPEEDIQSLRIRYTDWSGGEHSAWLFRHPTLGYRFVSMSASGMQLDPATCINDGTCGYAETIKYIDHSGIQYEASVVPPQVPTVAPTWSPLHPSVGELVTFNANGFSSVGASITYDWQISCPIDGFGGPLPPCFFFGAVAPTSATGPSFAMTFPTNGSYFIELVAKDSNNRTGTAGFRVEVANVAPTLSIYGPCPPFLICPRFNVFEVMKGTLTALGGEVIHAGLADQEVIAIDWGDGTTGFATRLPQQAFTTGGKIHLPFGATHAYANEGMYTVKVTVTDQAGAQDMTTVTERVVAANATIVTATTVSTMPNPATVGQAITHQATVSPVPDGGTMAFKDGANVIAACAALPLAANGRATCSTSAGAAGPHTITALYGGHGDYRASTSSSVSLTVKKAKTSPSVSSGGNPSILGQLLTFIVQILVTDSGAGTPTGTVRFTVDNVDAAGCTDVPIDPITGKARCTMALDLGPHRIVAHYSGDDDFEGSTSAALVQNVCESADCPPPPTPIANGGECSAAALCESGICADGVCCDRACTGTLERCDGMTPGVCLAVGAPAPAPALSWQGLLMALFTLLAAAAVALRRRRS